MIISCGLTTSEKVKLLEMPHKHFIIWPRVVDIVNGVEICAFMQYVERKGELHHDFDGCAVWRWSYRLLPSESSKVDK